MINQLKMKKFLMLALIMLLAAHCLSAQEKDSLKIRAIQFSFITPVGTNGLSSCYIDASSPQTFTLITGASSGLGKEFTLDCARRNMNLILVALPDRKMKILVTGATALSLNLPRQQILNFVAELDI